jgi:predicted enzyme related to lactoylglutathione lyase
VAVARDWPDARSRDAGPDSRIVSSAVNGGAVLYVKHLDRMRRFYSECFALRTVETTEAYCVLESDAWTLTLVVVPEEIAARIHLADPAQARDDVPVKLAFAVPSIDDLRVALTELGGQIDPDVDPWDLRGLRHCDVIDPEGNVVQLREPVAGYA